MPRILAGWEGFARSTGMAARTVPPGGSPSAPTGMLDERRGGAFHVALDDGADR